MEDFKEPQEMNGDLHLQELRQRINAKVASLLKMQLKTEKVSRWKRIAVIAVCVILFAFLVWCEVDSYGSIYFWGLNTFIVVDLIGYFVMYRIMRHFLTRMKNAGTAPQHYRAAKQLINTHKLQQWLPLIVGYICAQFFTNGLESLASAIGVGSILTLGPILSAMMQNWNIDDEWTGEKYLQFKVRLDGEWTDSWANYEPIHDRCWNSQSNVPVKEAVVGKSLKFKVYFDIKNDSPAAIANNYWSCWEDYGDDFNYLNVYYEIISTGDLIIPNTSDCTETYLSATFLMILSAGAILFLTQRKFS